MRTLFTALTALAMTSGVALAETPGDPELYGLVEAGNPVATVDMREAAGFTANPAPAPQQPRFTSEVGNHALFGLVQAGNSQVSVDIRGAAGFTRDYGAASSGVIGDPASGLDRILR